MNPISECLRKAAVLVDSCGHSRYALTGPQGELHATQAIVLASTERDVVLDAMLMFRLYLALEYGPKHVNISEWNDHKDRTRKDVVAALNTAALWSAINQEANSGEPE